MKSKDLREDPLRARPNTVSLRTGSRLWDTKRRTPHNFYACCGPVREPSVDEPSPEETDMPQCHLSSYFDGDGDHGGYDDGVREHSTALTALRHIIRARALQPSSRAGCA
jgi:hypothetical protein